MEKKKKEAEGADPCRLLGYEVVKNGNRDSDIAYFLKGKWTVYWLLRHKDRPEFMYALNTKRKICSIKGYSAFTDRGGKLKCMVKEKGATKGT